MRTQESVWHQNNYYAVGVTCRSSNPPKRCRKKRKAVQVRARNWIKWSTPGHRRTWIEN